MAQLKKLMAISIFSFMCLTLVSTNCLAQSSAMRVQVEQKQIIDDFVRTYAASSNLNDFVEREKEILPTSDYEFLKEQLAGTSEANRPVMTRRSELEFALKVDGQLVRYELIAGDQHHIRINNHTLDFGSAHTTEQRWNLIRSALPQKTSASLLSIIFPAANAGNWESVGKVGGNLLAYGGVGMLFGFVGQKDGVCSSLKTAVTDCRKVLAQMRGHKKWLDQEKQHEDALAAAGAKPVKPVAANPKPKPKPTPKKHKKKKDDDGEDKDDEPFDAMTYDITEEDGYGDIRDTYIEAMGQIDDLQGQTQSVANAFCAKDFKKEAQICRAEAEGYAVKLKLDDGKPAASKSAAPPASAPANTTK